MKKASSDLKAKLATESESRTRDVEGIKKDMARIPRGGGGGAPAGPGIGREDLDQVLLIVFSYF